MIFFVVHGTRNRLHFVVLVIGSGAYFYWIYSLKYHEYNLKENGIAPLNVLTTGERSLILQVNKRFTINYDKLVETNTQDKANKHVVSELPLFQSLKEEEFPSTDTDVPRIPHIIHHMYKTEMIPGMYTAHVKSFIYYNPTWTYRFWTDESGRKLLQKQYPHLVDIYDKFGNNVKRSDMLRYAVLYEYGGFYADFDMENFRSLNITTLKYACIFPVEPFEHSALLYNKHFIINNAFIGCRPKHPFFKLLLVGLQNADFNGDPVSTTGPGYVTRKFLEYNNISVSSSEMNKTDWSSNSPYFYKGELKEIDKNAVYVPNSQYFMDKIDPMLLETNGQITKACKHVNTLTYLKQRACFELLRREKIRKNRLYTFTVHHWYHLWLMTKDKIHSLKSTNIKEIVPNFIQYNG
ncbi:uncharacterized protein LOC132750284 isoform X1 [Ruditapes philippinarum]|uniref:uncharacterized protein LOC132750284 isoform X1 n=1 Tax=Ruditapes philippinarum TaxID=129788 RepID=UPI00295BD2E3|nr:uncharacterized protein LOC132750284 isoform X1 [Ruditapes philippinarum]